MKVDEEIESEMKKVASSSQKKQAIMPYIYI